MLQRHRLGSWVRLPVMSTLSIAMVLVAMLWGLVAWALTDARDMVRMAAEQNGTNIALTLERDIGRVITILDLSLRATVQGVRTPGLAWMAPAIQQAILFDGAIGAREFGGIIVADKSGDVLYSSAEPSSPTMHIAERASFQNHRDHADLGMTISAPRLNRTDNRQIIDISRRINDADGSFSGVAIAELRLDYFRTLFSAIDIGQSGAIILLNTERMVLVRRPYADHHLGRILGAEQLFRLLAASPSGTYEDVSTIDGLRRLYAYRKIEALPLVLIVGRSKQEVFAAWNVKAAAIGGAFLVLSIFGLGLAWRLQRELYCRTEAERAARKAEAEAVQLTVDLSRALAPFEALFQNSQATMLSVNVSAEGGFAYEAVNPVWEGVFGLSNAAVTGRSPEACLPPALADVILRNWITCVRERRVVRFDFQTSQSTKLRDWEAMVVPVFDETGAVRRLIAVGRELTERNQLEAQLRQAQKMEVIGRLAAGVSHDFNNILQIITGAAGMLQGCDGLSERAGNFLVMIDRAARRGAHLTHHLLSYSRKQMLAPSLLDPTEVLDTLQAVLSRTLGSQIIVTTDVADSVGLLRADRSQLETALINLAINAAYAMKNGGRLCFAISSAESELFGELVPGRHVVIAATDNGTGMSPEVMACVFEPFFTTKGVEGSGLGLAMVQGFARQSGGDVRVSSKLGEGTTFEIWLPEAEIGAAPDVDYDQREPPPPQAARVLLVDDDADVLDTLAAVLSSGEFTIRQALGGQQALAAFLAGERFDVVVTDYSMPDLNGVALIENARRFQPGIPAVIVTGFSDVMDGVTDLAGIVVLQKPLRGEQLVDCINEQVARVRAPAFLGAAA